LDGYSVGIPGRKVSIYDEGSLIAWMLDFMIRSATGMEKSLDDVMRQMYQRFGLKEVGYAGDDFLKLCEDVSGRDFEWFFKEVVCRPNTMIELLRETISLAGLSIHQSDSSHLFEKHLGFRLMGSRLRSVFPGSPAALAGMVIDGEILKVNEVPFTDGLNASYFSDLAPGDSMKIVYKSFGRVRTHDLQVTEETWYQQYRIVSDPLVSEPQLRFRESWLSI
jgi:predicted metalloprotease with PDZ domain